MLSPTKKAGTSYRGGVGGGNSGVGIAAALLSGSECSKWGITFVMILMLPFIVPVVHLPTNKLGAEPNNAVNEWATPCTSDNVYEGDIVLVRYDLRCYIHKKWKQVYFPHTLWFVAKIGLSINNYPEE